jgi:hypothetical protein
MLMTTRWLQDEACTYFNSIFNEQLIGISTKSLNQANYTTLYQPVFISKYYNYIQEV